jgi:hypothetical protein
MCYQLLWTKYSAQSCSNRKCDNVDFSITYTYVVLWVLKWEIVGHNNSPLHRHTVTLYPLHKTSLVFVGNCYAIAMSDGGSISYHLICLGPIIRNCGVRLKRMLNHAHTPTRALTHAHAVREHRKYITYVTCDHPKYIFLPNVEMCEVCEHDIYAAHATCGDPWAHLEILRPNINI